MCEPTTYQEEHAATFGAGTLRPPWYCGEAPALAVLTPQQRQAVDLRREGLTYMEIGFRLGIRTSSAQARVRRALHRLGMADPGWPRTAR